MSEMLTIQTQLTSEGMEEDLDRQDIIRDIFNKKLPFMSEEFYKSEIKKQKKDPKYRMKFEDMLQALSDKVRTMKAQGISSNKDDAKIAAFDRNDNNDTWRKKAASPPNQNPPTKSSVIKCFVCNASHPLEKCNKLRNMTIERRTEILRKDNRCFRCLEKDGHIAKFCQSEGFKCSECPYNHPTILHGLYEMRQKQRQEQNAAHHQQKLNGKIDRPDGGSNDQITNTDSEGKNSSQARLNLHASGELDNTLNESSSVDNLPLIPNVTTT